MAGPELPAACGVCQTGRTSVSCGPASAQAWIRGTFYPGTASQPQPGSVSFAPTPPLACGLRVTFWPVLVSGGRGAGGAAAAGGWELDRGAAGGADAAGRNSPITWSKLIGEQMHCVAMTTGGFTAA